MSPASSGEVVLLRDNNQEARRWAAAIRDATNKRYGSWKPAAEPSDAPWSVVSDQAGERSRSRTDQLLLRASVVIPLPAVLDEQKGRWKSPASQPDSETGKDHRGLRDPIGRRRKAGDDHGSDNKIRTTGGVENGVVRLRSERQLEG